MIEMVDSLFLISELPGYDFLRCFFDDFCFKKRCFNTQFLILFGIRIMERWISGKDQNPLFGRWARNMVHLLFFSESFLEVWSSPGVSHWQNESLIYPPPHPGCTRGNERFFLRFASPKKYVMSSWSLVHEVFSHQDTPMPSHKW